MAISQLTLEDFTVFERAELPLVTGVNVFIGANGTGKSHAMKAAYAALMACASGQVSAAALDGELAEVFRPLDAKVGRLARRRSGRGGNNRGRVSIRLDSGAECTFTLHSKGSPDMVRLERAPKGPVPSATFVPPHEMLAMFEGFIASYESRELSFDKTYRDLALALSATKLRAVDPSLQAPLASLRGQSGEVVLESGRFFLKSGGAKLEAPLEAEGLRKIGTLVRLIETGAVRPGSVLFWDEPEANLNPKLSAAVVDSIVALARSAQIVLATHDYLVARRLSLISQSGTADTPIRFFSFARPGKNKPAVVKVAANLADLEDDVLTDAFMDQMNYEYSLAPRR